MKIVRGIALWLYLAICDIYQIFYGDICKPDSIKVYEAYWLSKRYKDSKCSICLEYFNINIPQSLLKCGHRFCRKCINKNEHQRWISEKDPFYRYCYSKCPNCNGFYNIMWEKFDYDYDNYKYTGFWSLQPMTRERSPCIDLYELYKNYYVTIWN